MDTEQPWQFDGGYRIKQGILILAQLSADFSDGSAHPAARPLISATHPSPLDSRIDSGTHPAKVSITGLGDGFP
jgi:hypothetical protein